MAGGFSLISALFLIVFLEETNYRRDLNVPVIEHRGDVASVADGNAAKAKGTTTTIVAPAEDTDAKALDDASRPVHVSERVTTPWPGPRPWKMFTISPNARGIMLRGVIYPIMLVRHPVVLWCGLIYGLYQICFNCKASHSTRPLISSASGALFRRAVGPTVQLCTKQRRAHLPLPPDCDDAGRDSRRPHS